MKYVVKRVCSDKLRQSGRATTLLWHPIGPWHVSPNRPERRILIRCLLGGVHKSHVRRESLEINNL